MKQVTLSKKDIKDLNNEIRGRYGKEEFFAKSDFLKLADDTYVMRDDEVLFFYRENALLPSLRLVLKDNFLKKVVVDMGAVPFAAKGADMMRPGIVGVDTGVKENDIVAIVDEKNLKPIAIGQSLFSKEEIQDMEAGKIVLNLHHVGDEVWNFSIGE